MPKVISRSITLQTIWSKSPNSHSCRLGQKHYSKLYSPSFLDRCIEVAAIIFLIVHASDPSHFVCCSRSKQSKRAPLFLSIEPALKNLRYHPWALPNCRRDRSNGNKNIEKQLRGWDRFGQEGRQQRLTYQESEARLLCLWFGGHGCGCLMTKS